MLILELATQAIRACSPSSRATLKPGYTVLRSRANEVAPMGQAISAMLYADHHGSIGHLLAAGAKNGRLGLSFQDQDGATWRVVRDAAGSSALHRMNPATSKFEVAAQVPADMAQMIRNVTDLPSRAEFEQLFLVTESHWPSRGGKGPTKAPAASSLSPEELLEAKARIGVLEEEMAQAKSLAELQFRQDGVNSELYKLEGRLKGYEELRIKVDQTWNEMQTAPTPASIGAPENIVELVHQYPDLVRRRKDAFNKLENEREAAGVAYQAPAAVYPVYKEREFQLGLAAGLVFMTLGFIVPGSWSYVALLAPVGYTYAALLALRWIAALQDVSRTGATSEVFVQRERRIKEEFDATIGAVDAAVGAVGVATREEFLAAMAKPERLAEELKVLEAQLAEASAGDDVAMITARVAELKQEQEEISNELNSRAGGYLRDTREIERELEKLREAAGLEASAGFSAASPAASGLKDFGPGVFVLASSLLGGDVASVWASLKDRCAQYVAGLTEKRMHGLDVDAAGKVSVLAPGRKVSVANLEPADADLAYLALRFTIAEKVSATRQVPFIFEDFAGAASTPPQRAMLLRMLKHLGTKTQVLHVTPASHNGAAGEEMAIL